MLLAACSKRPRACSTKTDQLLRRFPISGSTERRDGTQLHRGPPGPLWFFYRRAPELALEPPRITSFSS